MNRRLFFRNSVLAGSFFGAGYLTRYLFAENKSNLIEGEEWRSDRKVNEADLKNLAADEEVLARAQKNIEKYRKSKVSIQFLDKAGNPLNNQKIKVEQLDHEMDWGYSQAGTLSNLDDPQKAKKAEYIAQLFNCTTAKCYWNERWHQPIEKYQNVRIYDLFLEEVAWAEEMKMRVKGHPLIWTVEKSIPKWLFQYPYSEQLKYLKAHVQSLIELVGKRVTRWDLCNEMLWEPAFKNIAQRNWPHIDPIEDIADYISQGIQWAREINPDAIYSLNDYGLVLTYVKKISAGEQRQRYLQLVQALKKRGNDPDAIGSQAHIGGKFPLGAFERMLDELSGSGLPLQVTEFWTREKDYPKSLGESERETAMAKYLENIYTVAFSKPTLTHFTYWGAGPFFTPENEPREPYKTLYALIKEKWMTKLHTTSNQQGTVNFQGFKGNYNLYINQTKVQKKIAKSKEDISIRINE